MSTWKTIVAVIIIFALGTVFGIVISRQIAPGPPHPRGPVQALPMPELNRLFEQDLTLEQRQEIAQILERVQRDLDRIRDRARPEIDRRMHEARKQIREILTPEQQIRFDRMIQEHPIPFDRPFRP